MWEKTMDHYYRIQDATVIDQDSRRKKILGSRTLKEGENKKTKLKMIRRKVERWTLARKILSPFVLTSSIVLQFFFLAPRIHFILLIQCSLPHFTIATGSWLLLSLWCPPVCSPFVFLKTDCPSLSAVRGTHADYFPLGDFCFWLSLS